MDGNEMSLKEKVPTLQRIKKVEEIQRDTYDLYRGTHDYFKGTYMERVNGSHQ